MQNYDKILSLYATAKKDAKYDFKTITSFKVCKNKVVDEHYLYETVIKIKLITGRFSLPDRWRYGNVETLEHSTDCNQTSYVGSCGIVSPQLAKLIDEYELPDEYKIRLYLPFLVVIVPILSILFLVASILLTSYILTVVGVLLYALPKWLNYERCYIREATSINKRIDDDVKQMRVAIKEFLAYENDISPDQVDADIDSMSYMELKRLEESFS